MPSPSAPGKLQGPSGCVLCHILGFPLSLKAPAERWRQCRQGKHSPRSACSQFPRWEQTHSGNLSAWTCPDH